MCGLYGIASTHFSESDITLFKNLGFLNCFRGTDSAGFLSVHKKGNKHRVNFLKKATHPIALLNSGTSKDIMLDKTCILAGHNRAATKGSINDENSHPFLKGAILGMHNGTIPALAEKDQTDSEKLYAILAEKGLQAAVDAARWGAYALVWVDNKKSTINFLRNEQRPLWFGRLPGNVVAWTSERRVFDFLGGFTDITLLPSNEHHTIEYGDTKINKVGEVKPTPYQYTAPTKQFKAPSSNIQSSFTAGYPYVRPDLATKMADFRAKKKESEGVKSSFKYIGYQGSTYAPRYIEAKLADGCACCTGNTSTLQDLVHWINHDEYVCDDCKQRGVFEEQLGQKPSYASRIEYTH